MNTVDSGKRHRINSIKVSYCASLRRTVHSLFIAKGARVRRRWLQLLGRRMARNILCLWSCLISAFIYTGVHGDLEQETKEKDIQLFEKNNDFAFRLYKGIVAQPDSQSNNVFFSPLSVSTALAALSLGAGGQTHQELFSGLGFNSSGFTSEEVHQAFLSLLQSLNKRTGVDLDVGTALYVQDTFKPHAEFLEKMKRFYLSDGFSVDFTKTAETTEQINKYVSEKTHDKISEFVEDLDPNTIMYLLSYIYFRGKWIKPFDPKYTEQKDFHVDNDTTVPVQMMFANKYFDVYHDQKVSAHALCLHYNDSFSMMLVLPDNSLSALEDVVSSQHVATWLGNMKSQKYEVYIPKLSLKTETRLKPILSGMGMADMFSGGANFTGISSEKLLVSEALHKATLDVDETGATATAVTGITLVGASLYMPPVLNFNRPFMIFVVDRENKNVLFMGKVVNPSK